MNTVVLSALALLAAIGLIAPALAQATPEPSPAAGAATVTPLSLDGQPMSLSPDGTSLAGTSDDQFCVWSVPDLDPSCADFPEVSLVEPRSVSWSPDSSHVAFSLNAPMYFRDSDIFIFSADDATLTNLTSENGGETAPDLMNADTPQQVDPWPTWSPDGSELAFARTPWSQDSNDRSTTIMTIPANGGEPTEWGVASDTMPLLISSTMVWRSAEDVANADAGLGDPGASPVPEGDMIVYATWPADPNDSANGIFIIREGQDPIQVVDSIQSPVIAQSFGGGAFLSVVSLVAYGVYGQTEAYPNANWLVLITNDEAEVMRATDVLELPTDPESIATEPRLTAPLLASPDGSRGALLLQANASLSLQLWDDSMTTETGCDMVASFAPESSTVGGPIILPQFQWAKNDLIFVAWGHGAWLIDISAAPAPSPTASPVPPCGCTPPEPHGARGMLRVG